MLDALTAEIDAVITGAGRAVFLLGPAGSGATSCLAIYQEEAFRRHRKLRAEYVDCAYSGAKTWIELAELFTRGHRLRRSAQRIAVDWMESIPIIGKVLQAVVRTVQVIRTGRVEEQRATVALSPQDSALAAVRLLLQFGPREPRLVIMDSLDRGDAEDLAGASALIRRLPDTRTLFLAAVRTSDGRPPGPIADLILEAERLDRAVRIELPPLSDKQVEETVAQATGGPVSQDWVDWLVAETHGYPGELWSLLGTLEREGQLRKTGRHWIWDSSTPTASSRSSAVPSHEWDLTEDEYRLLALATIEGRVFHSAVLAELAEIEELEVEDRLSRLCRAGLLEYRGETDVAGDVTSVYAFLDTKYAEAFAAELPEGERAKLYIQARGTRRELGIGGAHE